MLKLIGRNLKGKALFCALLAPLFILVEVLMDLQQPTLMSQIVDVGIANSDLNYVIHTGLKMLGFTFLGMLGGAGCGILATFASVRFGGELRTALFNKIFRLDCRQIDELETASLVTRMTGDISQVQLMMLMMMRAMIRSPVLCIGSIVMAFTLSPRLALLLCIVIPVLALAAVLVVRHAIPLYGKTQKWLDKINMAIRENLLGIRVVKSLTLEKTRAKQFDETNTEFCDSSIHAQTTTFLLMPIVTLVMNFSIVAVLWFGGKLQMAGSLPEGRIMAFINYLVQISSTLTMLVHLSINISRAQASAVRIQQVFDAKNTVLPPEHPTEPEGFDLEFKNVSFSYGGGGEVLKNIDFTVPQGQTLGIIGATGCGKSTVAALAARLYDPDEGQILIGGADLRDIGEETLRKSVGIVLQNVRLFSGSVADNLRYGKSDAEEAELWSAAEDAAAGDFLEQMPEGLQSEVKQRGSNFSGGQKQRLSIARSLVQRPEILILDDSTSALDMLTEARLQKRLRARSEGSTVIYIAQRISGIMHCDNILVMEQGRIIAQGTHEKLVEGCEVYRLIAKSQLGEEA